MPASSETAPLVRQVDNNDDNVIPRPRTDQSPPAERGYADWRQKSFLAATVVVTTVFLAMAVLRPSSPSVSVSTLTPPPPHSIMAMSVADAVSLQSSSSVMVDFHSCPDTKNTTVLENGIVDFTFDYGAGIYELSILDSPNGPSYLRSMLWIAQVSPNGLTLVYDVLMEGETDILPSVYLRVSPDEAAADVLRVLSAAVDARFTVEWSFVCDGNLGYQVTSNWVLAPSQVAVTSILSSAPRLETMGVIHRPERGNKVKAQAGVWPDVVSVEGVVLEEDSFAALLGFGMRASPDSDETLPNVMELQTAPLAVTVDFFLARHD